MSSRSPARTRAAEAALFLTATAWGSTFFLTKQSLAWVDPLVLVGYRFSAAALLLLLGLAARRRGVLENARRGLILGIVLCVVLVAQTIGLGYTRASNSGFITGTSVVFVPLIALVVSRSVPRPPTMIAVAACILGLLLLTSGVRGFNRGDALTLLCAFAAGVHILLVDSIRRRGTDPYILGVQQFAVVGTLSLFMGAILQRPFVVERRETALVILYLALVPTLLAYVIQLVAQRHTSPTRTALILVQESPIAAIFAWTLGGEAPRWNGVVGGALMLAALMVADATIHQERRGPGPPHAGPNAVPHVEE